MATFNVFELLGDEESDASAVVERAVAAAEKPVSKKKKKKQQQQQPQSHQQDKHQEQAQQQQQQQPPAKLPAQTARESNFAQLDSSRGRGRGRGSYGTIDREGKGTFTYPGFTGDPGSYEDVNNNNQDGSDFQGGRNGFQRGRGRYYGRGGAPGYGTAPSSWEDAEGGQNSRGIGQRGRDRGQGPARARDFVEGTEGDRPAYGNWNEDEVPHPRREYIRRSGTGQGYTIKKDSPGVGKRGTEAEQEGYLESGRGSVETKSGTEGEKHGTEVVKQQPAEEIKEEPETVQEKKEDEEDKEMLLEDYYKILDEKKRQIQLLKHEERKVIADKDFERMRLLDKKHDEGILLKPASEKDKGKKKDTSEKEDKPKKSLSINEFLRPMEGEGHYSSVGRGGRRRERGDRGGYRGGFGGRYDNTRQALAPRIEDPGQFPTLGAKQEKVV